MKEFTCNSFVFYKSFIESYLELKTKNKDLATKFLESVIFYGLGSSYEEDEFIVNILMKDVKRSIDNAKIRHGKAIINGNKGGRPTKVEYSKITELKEKGYNASQIAGIVGLSERQIYRIFEKNESTDITDITLTKPRHNLDVYVDIDKDVDTDKDIDKDKDSKVSKEEIERIIDSYGNPDTYHEGELDPPVPVLHNSHQESEDEVFDLPW